MRLIRFIPAIATVLLAASTGRGLTEREIYNVLEDRGIPFDGAAVQAGAVEGMVKAVDPRGRIVPIDEAPKPVSKPAIDGAEEWPEGICYLKMNGLWPGAGTDVVARVVAWTQAAKTGVIIDLRGAAGTNLASVPEIAGLFVPAGADLFVVRDGRGRTQETFRVAESAVPTSCIPVMVALDSDTREASEVLAGVLRGQPRVMLIGGKTRGDSALRETIPVSKTEGLFLATRWVVLGGEASPLTNGVQPDVAITTYSRTRPADKPPFGRKFSEKTKQDKELMERVLNDAVLGSATDILLGLKALGLHVVTTNTPAESAK